jgi:hypothetical protein
MKSNQIFQAGEQPRQALTPSFSPGQLRAGKAVCRDRGISDTTLWRWGQRGWIRLVNIYGRCYVDLPSLAEFDRRAALGEYAKPPSGAAKKAATQRQEREKGGAK